MWLICVYACIVVVSDMGWLSTSENCYKQVVWGVCNFRTNLYSNGDASKLQWWKPLEIDSTKSMPVLSFRIFTIGQQQSCGFPANASMSCSCVGREVSFLYRQMSSVQNPCWLLIRNGITHYAILLGGLVAIVYFPINIGNFIIPIDELIFFRGVNQPPTRIVVGDDPQGQRRAKPLLKHHENSKRWPLQMAILGKSTISANPEICSIQEELHLGLKKWRSNSELNTFLNMGHAHPCHLLCFFSIPNLFGVCLLDSPPLRLGSPSFPLLDAAWCCGKIFAIISLWFHLVSSTHYYLPAGFHHGVYSSSCVGSVSLPK